jgi:predicted ATPase/DNA-binding winged helix-turn-helix (wHTH) protein
MGARMFTQGNRTVYETGDCEVDLARREFRARGIIVPLGSRAFEIVETLIQSPGELVTKDELINRVWSGAIVEENTLQVHISAIRKALGPNRGLLKTESGRGYRLLGRWTPRENSVPAFSIGTERVPIPQRSINLTPTSDLIGQAATVQRIQSLLSAYRVVTLTGPGGIGKTALALGAAQGVVSEFDSGCWVVELGSLSDPNLVPSTVIGVLGLKLAGEASSAEAVARAIGGQNLLLVLDNCEHVIDAAADFTERLVRLCPHTTVLATSREVLRIAGEFVYRIPPLEVPAADREDPDDILGHSAVDLFMARTKALDMDFSTHPENLPAIAAICRHLDGIPLAIEFAAARAAALGVSQVAVGLRDRFALLTSGRRTALPRHRTLRATFDWSYDLLPKAERLLLCRLAVFPGGFTREAAIAIMKDTGAEAPAVVDGIANLVTKSLVTLDNSTARWSLLETTRAYALEKLTADGEADTAARQHAEYLRDLLGPSSDRGSPLSDEDLARRLREIDNVRAALDWSFSAVGDPAIGVDLTAAYAPIWLRIRSSKALSRRRSLASGSWMRRSKPSMTP